jgi:hypothetical protein
MSKDCYPDIVLKLRRGGSLRTIILDAKYRASRESIHAALCDIHIYRDAIRRDAENSAVHAAFILTPAHHGDSQRYYTEDYREKFAFGGFDLAPRNQTQVGELVRALTGWVNEGE